MPCLNRRTTLVATGLLRADDWPQWRGPDRTNRSAETGLFTTWKEDGPPLAWIANGMGSGYASVSVSDSRIFTTGNVDDRQSVVAVDATDGSVLWTTPISPVIADGVLYLREQGKLMAYRLTP